MSNIASYEQEVLATVERRLREVTTSPAWTDPKRQVREVRLEGEFPDTKLVVVFDDPKLGAGLTEEFLIHKISRGLQEPHNTDILATIVWANIDEFGR